MPRDSPEDWGASLAGVVAIARRLLGEDGCPWDRQQTLESMTPYVIEEAYEVAEAIQHADAAAIAEEIGDVLFLVIFLAELMEARHGVTLADIARANADKLRRRHPHVFGDEKADSAETALHRWEEMKAAEKQAGETPHDPLGRAPVGLPSLLAAYRTQQKAAAAGFDWRSPEDALAKVHEEVRELAGAHASGSRARAEEELGDTLFALATYGRHMGWDAEQVLHTAVRRFRARYARMHDAVARGGGSIRTAGDATLADAWRVAKETPD
jgi:MazG family protein